MIFLTIFFERCIPYFPKDRHADVARKPLYA